MRRITLWLFSTVAALVLLFSYRTSTTSTSAAATAAVAPAATPPAADTPTTTAPTTTAPIPSITGSGKASSGAASSTPKAYSGSVASTRWGDVQVTITVTGGRITDVAVPVYPSDNGRDQEINAYALPALKQETLAAQSANIAAVSGATVTSDGYIESLQAALDAAQLG